MRAIDKLAALAALRVGIAAVEAELKQEILTIHALTGSKSFERGVYVATKGGRPEITDEAAFLAWVQQNAPSEIVPSVRDSYREAVVRSFIVSSGEVITRITGETVEWASIGPEVKYAAARLTLAEKAEAIAAVSARLDEIAGFTRGELEP